MSLLRLWGFESGSRDMEYATDTSSGGFTYADVSGTISRTGRYSLRVHNNNLQIPFSCNGKPSDPWNGGIQGAALGTSCWFTGWLYLVSVPDATTCIINGINGDSTVFGTQIDNTAVLLLKSDGSLKLAYNTNAANPQSGMTDTELGTGSSPLSLNTWHRIDFSFEHAANSQSGTGALELRVDGSLIDRVTGITFVTTGIRTANGITSFDLTNRIIGSATVTGDWYWDDIWLDSAAFADNDGGINPIKVNAAGNYTGWGGSFTSLDELPSDGTTTELSVSAPAVSTFGLQSAAEGGIGGTIKAVRALAIIRRTVATNLPVCTVRMRSGSTDSDSAVTGTGHNIQTNYKGGMIEYALETDPATGVAWTTGGLDALEIGVNQTASSTSCQWTTMYAEVWSTSPTFRQPTTRYGIHLFEGFEIGDRVAYAGSGLISGSVGGWTIDNAVVRTGKYCAKAVATSATSDTMFLPGLAADGNRSNNTFQSPVGSTRYIQFYLRIATAVSTDHPNFLMYGSQCRLSLTTSSTIQLRLGDSPWNLQVTSSALSSNQWYKVGVKITNALTSGSVGLELFINDVSQGSTTGLTISSATDNILQLVSPNTTIGGVFYIDDVLAADDGFYDGGAIGIPVGSQGTDTAWTGSYLDVDDLPSDNGTTVISTTSSSVAESGVLAPPTNYGVAGTILAVIAFAQNQRAFGSAGQIIVRTLSGGTQVATTARNPGNSYEPFGIMETADTFGNWDMAGLSALEVGVATSSAALTSSQINATALWAQVWCTAPFIPAPTVTSISPSTGPKAGGTAVTITGTNFIAPCAVTIGGVDATSVVVVSSTSITCTTAGVQKAGTYDVIVSAAGGTGYLPLAYTYTPGNANGNGGNNAGGTVATVVVPTPTSPAPVLGDIMYAFITVRVTTTTVTQASWGAEIHSRSDGTNSITRVFRKIATGSEPANYTFTLGSIQKASGVIMVVPADVDITTQQIASQANASSANCAAPTLTPARPGAVSIFCAGTAVGTTVTPPTNWTEPTGADSASTGGSAATRTTTEGAYRVLTSTAATGTVTGVAAAAATNVGIQILLDVPNPDTAPSEKSPLPMLLPQ